MARSAPKRKHLKLYTEQPPEPVQPAIQTIAGIPELLTAFRAATGWQLQYHQESETNGRRGPVSLTTAATKESRAAKRSPDAKAAAGHVSPSATAAPDAAQTLADSLGGLLDELIETRDALRRREAELAAGVPVTPHREGEKHLAERLEAVLRAGVEAVEADAAALYLLDEATTELKVRSTWGLPFNRLIAPARSLAGALADLEAMLGHAVVLDEDDAVAWNMPEGFAAGVCIPVSSPTTLLGTLWVFSSEKRDFSPRQTNVLEVVAGRLAADLEREVLMDVGLDGARLQKQIAAAERRQRNELPTIAPMLDDWDLAGDTAQAGQVGGALHDWFSLPDGLMAIAAGRAAEDGLAGAWTANAAKTALRAHAGYHREPEPLLQQINRTLWTGSAGDRHASLLLGLVETATGRVGWASAGWPSILRFSPEGWQSLSRASVGLGEGPEAAFQHHECELQPGEAILICTDSVRDAQDAQGRPFGETGLAAAMQGKLELTAEELVSVVQAALEAHTGGASTGDRSILVLKRR